MKANSIPCKIVMAAALLSSITSSACADVTTDAAARLRGVRRIVFLGDSITQAGDYVTDFECGLLARGIQVEVLNLGLGSETATDLTSQACRARDTSYEKSTWPGVSIKLSV